MLRHLAQNKIVYPLPGFLILTFPVEWRNGKKSVLQPDLLKLGYNFCKSPYFFTVIHPAKMSFTPKHTETKSICLPYKASFRRSRIEALPKPMPKFQYEYFFPVISPISAAQFLYELNSVPIPSVIESPKTQRAL